MIERNKPKVVFLDWFGTLSSSIFWEQLKDPKHHRHDLATSLEVSMFTNLGHLINPWMRGAITTEEVMMQVSQDSGIPFEIVMEEFISGCRQMSFVSEEIPKLVEKLQRVGIQVWIATDNMDSLTRWTSEAMGLNTMFDGILNSYDLKALKGDIGNDGRLLFFRNFFENSDINPQETIIFDDSDHKLVVLTKGGINCIKVEPHTGLAPELKKLISELKSN